MFPLLLPLVVLLPASVCFGWGGEGHQLVALIAEEQLTPAARAAVTELLGGGNISDAEVASWADEIRRQRLYTADWHYVSIPHDAERFDANRDGRKGENVIEKGRRAGESAWRPDVAARAAG